MMFPLSNRWMNPARRGCCRMGKQAKRGDFFRPGVSTPLARTILRVQEDERKSNQIKFRRGGARTPDLLIWSQLLYQLSYTPIILLIPKMETTKSIYPIAGFSQYPFHGFQTLSWIPDLSSASFLIHQPDPVFFRPPGPLSISSPRRFPAPPPDAIPLFPAGGRAH